MHRRKLLLAAFCCFFYIFGRSQQFNWYFGNAAGITFNPGGAATPHFLTDGTNSAYEAIRAFAMIMETFCFMQMELPSLTAGTR